VDDSESLAALRRIAAEEAGLAPQLAGRIVGSTLAEMRSDAKKFAIESGISPGPQRDGHGRFSSRMDQEIRRRAGR
jgi:hypothetical protein